MIWRAAIVGQVFWLYGFLTPVGFPPPFARVETVAALQTDVGQIVDGLKQDRIDRLEGEIFSTRRLQCQAQTDEQKRAYSDRLRELVDKFRRITNAYPRMPGCDEV